MGSSGSGRFSDYTGTNKDKSGGGGSSGVDACSKPFECELEEVERSTYFSTHKALPAIDADLTLFFERRIGAQTSNGELVGYLPTQFNYVASCLREGWQFPATVINVTVKPFPRLWLRATPKR